MSLIRGNVGKGTVTLLHFAEWCDDESLIELCDEDGNLEVAGKAKVCWRCDGRGSHDCWEGGMTASEMYEEGPEFMEDYMNGVYSIPCSVCNGVRVVMGVSDHIDPRILAEIRSYEEGRAEMEADMRAERLAGC